MKFRAGWADSVIDLTPGSTITLRSDRNELAFVCKSPTEYFVLEHRRKIGRDLALPDQNLAIWHVDELGRNSHEQMSPTKHYECTLIQADGKSDLEHHVNIGDDADLYPSGANDTFGHTSRPASRLVGRQGGAGGHFRRDPERDDTTTVRTVGCSPASFVQ